MYCPNESPNGRCKQAKLAKFTSELDEELDGRINATKDAKHAYELAANATAQAKADLEAERDLTEAREPDPK